MIARLESELWTSRQRQMHSLHYVVSYRAAFKPELPNFFIDRYSQPGDVVLDPFGGRGTTMLEANLLGRCAINNDVNPISSMMAYAKTHPVSVDDISLRLDELPLSEPVPMDDFDMFAPFYHPDTYKEIVNLKKALLGSSTDVDRFIQLLALSRLHGHSTGFFSVYSFPQISVRPEAQRKINERRKQAPDYRPIADRILAKARASLQSGQLDQIRLWSRENRYLSHDSRNLEAIANNSIDLIVTSPPFLDKVDYLTDNWLEMWFCGVETESLAGILTPIRTLEQWVDLMTKSVAEMVRVLKPGGHCVIEVGDVVVDGTQVNLDEVVTDSVLQSPSVVRVKLVPIEILINQQQFTKLANCFGVANNVKGTNTNRLVVLQKADW